MRILGLDIGTTSIGFALIDLDKQRAAGAIVHMGVRIFPEARDPDGTPLNQTRRAKRMMRRQLRRRRKRRRSLNQLLASQSLLPSYGGDEWRSAMDADPYALRARGLQDALAPHELGRAIYHLSKRRHFKERDLAETGASAAQDEDDGAGHTPKRGKAKSQPKEGAVAEEAASSLARQHLVAELNASGQTLGQALAARAPDVRRRGEHATRALVEAEFDRLIQAQAPHHTALRDANVLGAVREAIFAQRPVFWRKSTLGKCRLMPEAPLAPKGSWLSQQRVMLEKVNNLAFTGGNARPLDKEERAAILATLSTQKSLTWRGARNVLEPLFKARGESNRSVKFNHETDKDEASGVKGNVVEAELANIFGSRWEAHPHKQALRDFAPDALWQADYGEIGTQRVVIRPEAERAKRRAVLAQSLVERFGANAEQAGKIVKLHFPQGWDAYSTAALQTLLPKLDEGERLGSLLTRPEFADWRNEAFPKRDQPTGEWVERLPSPRADRNATEAQRDEAERMKTIRNPTVVRVQNELRKVVNNLIGAYGRPELIRVELAREVGKSKREREEMAKGMRAKEALRKRARVDLIANGIAAPTADAVEKWLLWTECNETCPYTGDKIGFGDLFGGNPRFDVEHIWPKSKSLDNSARNKTLCRKEINLAKGNQIPFDYFRGRPDAWLAAKSRIQKMVGKDRMSEGKARRFCAESMPDDFANRQLNDTGYAARQALEFLKRLWPDVGPSGDVNVQPVTGKVTAQLRRRWGLNKVLATDGEKTRADHRHHALDALVVACADGGYTQKLSHYFEAESEYKRGRGAKPDDALVDPPWAGIRHDAETAVLGIVVSHRVRKKVSGPLHKETTYGDTGKDITRGGINYRIVVNRVPIAELSEADIGADDLATAKFVVRDAGVRKALRKHASTFGGDIKKAMAATVGLGPSGTPIRKVRLTSKRQLAMMEATHNGLVDPESKHHLTVYRNLNGEFEYEVVSVFEAMRRNNARKDVIARRNSKGSDFVMSVSKGDTLSLSDRRSPFWIVRELKSNGQLTLVPHFEARATKQALAFKPTIPGLMSLNPKKHQVDPIGRVRPAGD